MKHRPLPPTAPTLRLGPCPSHTPSNSSQEDGAAKKIASFKICGGTGIQASGCHWPIKGARPDCCEQGTQPPKGQLSMLLDGNATAREGHNQGPCHCSEAITSSYFLFWQGSRHKFTRVETHSSDPMDRLIAIQSERGWTWHSPPRGEQTHHQGQSLTAYHYLCVLDGPAPSWWRGGGGSQTEFKLKRL